MKDIAKLIPRWRDEINACPSAIEVKRPIKVHGPVLRVVDWDMSLHICPLGDEIGECLRLDRVAEPKIDCIGVELDRAFDDEAAGSLLWRMSPSGYSVMIAMW